MIDPVVSRLLHSVPALQPVAQAYDAGDVAVVQRPLDPRVQAVYAATPGALPEAPEITDTIVLNQRQSWDLEDSLYRRSIVVHEAYHCLDDLRSVGGSTGHLASEARAWTGQAHYLAEQLGQSPQPDSAVPSLMAELKESGMGELECLALLLALQAAPLPPAVQPVAATLARHLRGAASSLQGIEPLLERPAESLPQTLGLIYWSSPEARVPTDGVPPKASRPT